MLAAGDNHSMKVVWFSIGTITLVVGVAHIKCDDVLM